VAEIVGGIDLPLFELAAQRGHCQRDRLQFFFRAARGDDDFIERVRAPVLRGLVLP